MHRSRRTPLAATGLVATAVAVALLTAGCSGASKGATGASADPSTSASPSTGPSASASTPPPLVCPKPGSASQAVKVADKGATTEPGVSFPVPTSVDTTETSVLKAGSGDALKQGDTTRVAFVIYDAKSGKRLDGQGWGAKAPLTLAVDQAKFLPGLVQAFDCAKPGARIASVIPASQAFGDAGVEQLGVAGGDSLVLVGDVLGPAKTNALPSGFPAISLAADGRPTVRIPSSDPPKSLRIATRQQGTGDAVQAGDTVTVQYQGVNWRTGKVFDESWTKSGPTQFKTTDVVKGFGKALVGAKVGSQVVAIIPPSEGYGSKGQSAIGLKGTDTMVFVIDVLGTGRS